jgi:hypothetical protein
MSRQAARWGCPGQLLEGGRSSCWVGQGSNCPGLPSSGTRLGLAPRTCPTARPWADSPDLLGDPCRISVLIVLPVLPALGAD